jgi:ATP-dependent exoDNAse (exonuclease V) beta subunit
VLPLSRNFRSEPAIIDFVNTVGSSIVADTGTALETVCGERSVAYQVLTPHRSAALGGVEWIVPDAEERRPSEASHVAQRITELVGSAQVIDAHTSVARACRYSDIAILYRARTGLSAYHDALRTWGIPYFEHSPAGLDERQEVQDLLNVLRLLHNPADDLRAFAYLRSPFVGLRDEVLVRIRKQEGFGSYLEQAERFLESGSGSRPEHVAIGALERAALRKGSRVFERAATGGSPGDR